MDDFNRALQRRKPADIKSILVDLPEHTHFKFVQKVKYYDLTIQQVVNTLIEGFNDGVFDRYLSIPLD